MVERVVTVGGEVRRTSVFRNGVAVVVREKAGEKKRVLRQPLNEVELQVLTQIVDESYPDLTRFGSVGQSPVEGMVDLRLAPPGREPLFVRFPLAGVQSLGAARIGQALDGLEARMTGPGGIREDLRDWQPTVGDWLELEDGRVGQVIEVAAQRAGFPRACPDRHGPGLDFRERRGAAPHDGAPDQEVRITGGSWASRRVAGPGRGSVAPAHT